MTTFANDEAAASELGPRRPNPIDGHVGGRVRLRRMLLGISQEKLGEQLGLTFQQIQKYEKGVNRVSASRLFDLAQVLRVPVQYFFEDLPTGDRKDGVVADGFAEPRSESYVVDFLGSREGLELNKAFSRLTNPVHRRAVIELVRSLAGDHPASANSSDGAG